MSTTLQSGSEAKATISPRLNSDVQFVLEDAGANQCENETQARQAAKLGNLPPESHSSRHTNKSRSSPRPSEVAASMAAFHDIQQDPERSVPASHPYSIELADLGDHVRRPTTSERRKPSRQSPGHHSPKTLTFSRPALHARTLAAYSHLRESDFSEEVYGRVTEDDDLDALPLPLPKDSSASVDDDPTIQGRVLYLPGSAEAQDAEERSRYVESGLRSWGRVLQKWGVLQDDNEDEDADGESNQLGQRRGHANDSELNEEWEGYLFDFEGTNGTGNNASKSQHNSAATRANHDQRQVDSDGEDEPDMNDREVDNTLDTFPHTLSPEERARHRNLPRSVEPTIDVASGNTNGALHERNRENDIGNNAHASGSQGTTGSTFSRYGLRLRQFCAFFGMSILVAVGYMDPGNWETNLDSGSTFRYRLLWAVLASSILGYLFQYLAVKLGVATDRDLARMCRAVYSRRTNMFLWITAEIGIIATDIASIIGAAIALRMLTGLPLLVGILITMLDVILILFLQGRRQRVLELIVGIFALIIFISFCIQLTFVKANAADVLSGFVPAYDTFSDPRELVLTIGILGATVMPHNLYLHSALVQTRRYPRTPQGRELAVRLSAADSAVSLLAACFVNASIVILSAAAFYHPGESRTPPPTLEQAQLLLRTALGQRAAGFLFALALLLSGQASTVTSTLTGQFVMEGFLDLRLKPWIRRLGTRLVAIVPAVAILLIFGESALDELIVLSQVILSLQLSFAIVPLVWMTSNEDLMGFLVNSKRTRNVAYFATFVVIILNAYLLIRFLVLGGNS